MTSVRVKSDTDVPPAAIVSAEGCGRLNATTANATDIIICMAIIHHLLVFMMSTNGLQRGLITHGRYRRLVYIAISPLDMPILLNMITDILFTMKYGIPSAK